MKGRREAGKGKGEKDMDGKNWKEGEIDGGVRVGSRVEKK